MRKIKIAICIEDEIYQDRFVKCLMNHYQDRYELHVFNAYAEFDAYEAEEFAVVILGESRNELKEHMIVLDEQMRYQEVYKIVEKIEAVITENSTEERREADRKAQMLLVSSLTQPYLQVPAMVLLAEICSEQKKVLVIDLQAYSGSHDLLGGETGHLGLEDVLAVSMTGGYSKGRLTASIGHYRQWDYVYPARNATCLYEITEDTILNMIQILVKEFGYERVILNVGEEYLAMKGLLAVCDKFCFLCFKGGTENWREKVFFHEMECGEQDEFLHRINRIPISGISGTDNGWEKLCEQWKWNGIGDVFRKIVRE